MRSVRHQHSLNLLVAQLRSVPLQMQYVNSSELILPQWDFDNIPTALQAVTYKFYEKKEYDVKEAFSANNDCSTKVCTTFALIKSKLLDWPATLTFI